MRNADAPPPGWYPDPEGGVRLRWWEGTDWADRWRSRPGVGPGAVHSGASAEASIAASADQGVDPAAAFERVVDQAGEWSAGGRPSSYASAEAVGVVRKAVHSEMDRAAGMLTEQARTVARQIEPIVSEYSDRAARLLRRIVILVVVVLIVWLLIQALAQTSLLEWIGDRIDNLVEETSVAQLDG